MKLKDSLKKSEFIFIEGDKKSGKLTFSLFECALEKKQKVLIFSTYSKYLINKRLDTIKNLNIKELDNIFEKIKTLSLKEEWPKIKAKYGINFLLKDIYKAIENIKPDTIIFHRFDLFFESHEINELKIFLEEIVSHKSQNKIKLFFTASNESNKEIIENIENFSDINLEIKTNENKRIIEVKNSIYPIEYDTCEFLIKNNSVTLNPIIKNETEIIVNDKKELKKKILIITKNEDLRKTLLYVFKRDIFEIDIASKTSEIINKLLNDPDIIIYNPFDEELDFNVCTTIKEKKLHSKLIYITNQTYIRSDDKILGISHGCYEIFPYNFNILEFISEIEKIVQYNFYTYKASKIKNIKLISNKQMLCTILEELYNEKIFFSFIQLKTDYEINHDFLRQNDFIYKENNIYYITLTHTRLINLENIIKKIFKDNYEFEILHAIEAPDFINNKKVICQ
ncbi:hypothetical protein FE773_02855 [Caminibacter mediatlanticus TB-2]|uniref:KaiC-like domain-containing protein n=1 Tax=Caminibacter mediatlanticus TB-2 TaxID=391592 RepID=A0ABX5VC01_9BACT|nr:hypothetical protein [Caminibacter mediatlanticus]QCT94151.1 hypothetical protein FE773_02855 [Caminibacter mediatlanticus TB-2]